MCVAAVFMVMYGLFGRQMLYVFTSDHDVVAASMEFIPWLIPMPLVGCAAFTWDGIYVGATASRPIRNSSIWAMAGFFAVWFIMHGMTKTAISGNPAIAVHILLAAFLIHLIIRFTYETVLYRRSILEEPFR